MSYIIIGGIIGFSIFLLNLESPDLGNILFRIDSSGNKTLSIESVVNIMKAPLIYKQFWFNKNFLNINWIICVSCGMLCGYLYKYY